MSGNVFVFSFSNEGFETIVNLSAHSRRDVQDKLMGNGSGYGRVNEIIGMMKLRAEWNQHREMEVWLAKMDGSFTEEGLNEWAEEEPQIVANLVREHGVNVAGGDHSKKKKIIT